MPRDYWRTTSVLQLLKPPPKLRQTSPCIFLLSIASDIFRFRFGGGNGMEWKGMKRIILEYSFLPLFGSFNEGNGKIIPLFRSLSRRKWNG